MPTSYAVDFWLPKQGKLSPACRVVANMLEQLVESWGHQLTEPSA